MKHQHERDDGNRVKARGTLGADRISRHHRLRSDRRALKPQTRFS